MSAASIELKELPRHQSGALRHGAIARYLGSWLGLAIACSSLASEKPAAAEFDKDGFRTRLNFVPDVTKTPIAAAPEVPIVTSTNSAAIATTNSMDALDERHQLAIGDRLSFRIVEDEEDPKPLTVTDSGDLEMPYIGRFMAVGKTCKDLARQLKSELEKEYYYQATVIVAVDVMARSRGKVYLVGPVRAAGPQEIPSDERLTVSKAILRAGGFSEFANQHNVKVTRKSSRPGGPEESYVIDVGLVLQRGTTESDFPLEPGDLIYVSERLIRF